MNSARSYHGRWQTAGKAAKCRFRKDCNDSRMPVCERLQQRNPVLRHCHASCGATAWPLPDVKEDTGPRFVGRVRRVIDDQPAAIKRCCPHAFLADRKANSRPRCKLVVRRRRRIFDANAVGIDLQIIRKRGCGKTERPAEPIDTGRAAVVAFDLYRLVVARQMTKRPAPGNAFPAHIHRFGRSDKAPIGFRARTVRTTAAVRSDDANVGTVTSTRRLAFCIGAGQVWAKLPDAARHAQSKLTNAALPPHADCPQPGSFPSDTPEYQIAILGHLGLRPRYRDFHFNSTLRTESRTCSYSLAARLHAHGPAIRCRGLISRPGDKPSRH